MSKNAFIESTPAPQHPMDVFDLSHEKKLSCRMGELVPIYWDDITPGDMFQVRSEIFARFAPMLAPIMHQINLFTHYFWVPYRLLMTRLDATYADWEGYITGDPENEFTNQVVPYITLETYSQAMFDKNTLADYFGLPVIAQTTVGQPLDINAMPFLAYQLIYDNYYRDQNLEDKLCGPGHDITLQGGDRTSEHTDIMALRHRAWEKDYFTGALPTAYAGSSSDVELDLDVFGLGAVGSYEARFAKHPTAVPDAGDAKFTAASYDLKDVTGNSLYYHATQQGLTSTLEIYELRRAQALVRSLEAEQRGGKRYVEMLLGKFGVIADDYRTAIPQYLGGGKQYIQVEEVKNMTQTVDPTAGVNDGAGGVVVVEEPVATLAGNALSIGKTNGFKKRFTEHGVVIGIMSILPRTAYQGGIEKYWRKVNDRYEFFDPYLQGIGDQEIQQSEVWYDQSGSDADDTFGYVPRWSEYKFKNSTVHGDFRDDFDYWHCARKFTSAPSLNSAFVRPTALEDSFNRIFAVESASVRKCYVQIYNQVKAVRQMYLHDNPK